MYNIYIRYIYNIYPIRCSKNAAYKCTDWLRNVELMGSENDKDVARPAAPRHCVHLEILAMNSHIILALYVFRHSSLIHLPSEPMELL